MRYEGTIGEGVDHSMGKLHKSLKKTVTPCRLWSRQIIDTIRNTLDVNYYKPY
jgi:hypothetical protein